MKTLIQNIFFAKHSTQQKASINKDNLYNLLFSGRITLKEYLQIIKKLELQ